MQFLPCPVLFGRGFVLICHSLARIGPLDVPGSDLRRSFLPRQPQPLRRASELPHEQMAALQLDHLGLLGTLRGQHNCLLPTWRGALAKGFRDAMGLVKIQQASGQLAVHKVFFCSSETSKTCSNAED